MMHADYGNDTNYTLSRCHGHVKFVDVTKLLDEDAVRVAACRERPRRRRRTSTQQRGGKAPVSCRASHTATTADALLELVYLPTATRCADSATRSRVLLIVSAVFTDYHVD